MSAAFHENGVTSDEDPTLDREAGLAEVTSFEACAEGRRPHQPTARSSEVLVEKRPKGECAGVKVHVTSVGGNTVFSAMLAGDTTIRELLLDCLPQGIGQSAQLLQDGKLMDTKCGGVLLVDCISKEEDNVHFTLVKQVKKATANEMVREFHLPVPDQEREYMPLFEENEFFRQHWIRAEFPSVSPGRYRLIAVAARDPSKGGELAWFFVQPLVVQVESHEGVQLHSCAWDAVQELGRAYDEHLVACFDLPDRGDDWELRVSILDPLGNDRPTDGLAGVLFKSLELR